MLPVLVGLGNDSWICVSPFSNDKCREEHKTLCESVFWLVHLAVFTLRQQCLCLQSDYTRTVASLWQNIFRQAVWKGLNHFHVISKSCISAAVITLAEPSVRTWAPHARSIFGPSNEGFCLTFRFWVMKGAKTFGKWVRLFSTICFLIFTVEKNPKKTHSWKTQ